MRGFHSSIPSFVKKASYTPSMVFPFSHSQSHIPLAGTHLSVARPKALFLVTFNAHPFHKFPTHPHCKTIAPMLYRLLGRYEHLAKAGWADGRPVRGLSCSHTAVLQYSQAGAVKRDKGIEQASIEATLHIAQEGGQELATHAGCSGSHQVCTPTQCSYSYINSAQLGSYADRPPLAP